MPNTRPPASVLYRLLSLLGLVLVATCSDGTSGGQGVVAGYVTYDGGPVSGATVTAHQFFDGGETILAGSGTTDADGHFEIDVGQVFQQITVTAKGGTVHLVDGTTLTLDPAAELRAPVLDHPLKGRSDIVVSPFTDLAYRLGLARHAAHQDADDVASLRTAVAHINTHLGFDVVTVTPAPVTSAAAFDEHGKYAVALAGYDQLAVIAAHDLGVSSSAVNVRLLHDQVVRDASSTEARLDGNGAEVLSVGPSCPLPTGCTTEGPACYASCSVYVNSLRSRLAAASLAWLATPANRTGLGASDILTWATSLAANMDPELFVGDTEPVDEIGPSIQWATPTTGQVFTTGAIAIDVTATDPLGVASLTVDHVAGQTRTPIVDTDPAPDHFVGTLPLTPALAEGSLTLEARATDRNTTASTDARIVEINQLAGGAISGTAVKAALANAPVTVRAFADLATTIVTGTTDASGNFTNLTLPEGTHGDLLVEVGGAGSYAEDVQAATVVSLAATEKLAVVVPGYVDGDALSGLVVSPATTLAAAYLTYLQGANQGGTTLAAQWATAVSAIEHHLGVTGITTVVPSIPSQIDSLDDPDRYGLILLALSRTAWAASSLGGGDAGAFGSAVNAMKVLQVWVRDIGDGCWDGKAGPTALSYGGPTLLTDEATRLQLAQALVAYLGSPQNQTQFHAAADVLPLLDTIASGGGNTAPGACAGTNHLFDDPGRGFDREPPVITWGAFPSTDPYVRGSVTVTATATDNLPTLPIVTFTTGQTDIDVAVNGVRAIIDTTGMNGTVPLAVHAVDGSTNSSDATHDLIADNLNPAITISAPAMDGLFLRPPVTLGWNVVELNPMATTATLDGATAVTPGFQVATEGAHTLVVSAIDRAGGTGSATRTFTIDSTAPVLSVSGPADGSYVRGPVTISFSITDANPGATASATLDGAPFTSGGSVNVEGAHTLVVNGADAAGNPAASVTRTFTIDNTPPVLTVSAPAGGSFVRGPVTITFSATDNYPPATVTATLDGVGFSSGGQVNTEGAHTLVVNAVDRAGNPAPTVTRAFTVDNTAPVLAAVAAPSGTVVKPPLTITATATDNLMAAGSLGSDITVTSTPGPSTTTPGTSGGGNKTLAVTYTTIPDGPFTARFDVTDRAGNPASQIVVSKIIDATPPTLGWDVTAFTLLGADYWTGTATPALTGTVSDANLGSVIVSWAGGSVAATVAGGTWTTTLPAGAGLGLAGLDISVTATDLAGNPTAVTRHLRADVTPPVVAFGTTDVRQEDHDAVTFDSTLDATYGKKKYNPTHAHSATFSATLGPATACTVAAAPSVVKYAYLLDETPLYAIESGGTDAGGGNSLKWQLLPSDDGVGLTGARYRVIDVATGTTIVNWTSFAPASTLLKLYRNGTGGVAALGTAQGLLQLEVEATDRLGRATLQSRCWNQRLLAAPIVLDAADQATLPTNTASDQAAGKWGLSSLDLASAVVPAAPASMMLTTAAATGAAGLFEVPIYNPTNEAVYVSVDLSLPAISAGTDTVATWRTHSFDGRWVYRDATTNTNCGSVEADPGPPPRYAPDDTLPGCNTNTPTGNDPTDYDSGTTSNLIPVADFTIRAWTSPQTTTTLTEMTQCAGCSTTPAGSNRVRLTVLVPPRGTNTALPPVKVVLMPALRPHSRYRPHGTAAAEPPTEFFAGGTYLTGKSLATATQCVQWNAASSTDPSFVFRCTRTRSWVRARYLSSVAIGNISSQSIELATGISGTGTSTTIPHLLAPTNQRTFFGTSGWNTAEPAVPGL